MPPLANRFQRAAARIYEAYHETIRLQDDTCDPVAESKIVARASIGAKLTSFLMAADALFPLADRPVAEVALGLAALALSRVMAVELEDSKAAVLGEPPDHD